MLKKDKIVTVAQFVDNLVRHQGEELIVDYTGMIDTQIDIDSLLIEEKVDEKGDKCICLDSQNEIGYPIWVKEKDIEAIEEIFANEDYYIHLPNLDLHVYLDN